MTKSILCILSVHLITYLTVQETVENGHDQTLKKQTLNEVKFFQKSFRIAALKDQ